MSDNFFALVSNAGDGDISVLHFDAASAQLSPAGRCAVGERVMPMAMLPGGKSLYAGLRGSPPAFARFTVDAGLLAHHETTRVKESMAYISVDPSGRWLLGASYGDDLIAIYALAELRAGKGEPAQVLRGHRHAHSVIVSPDGRFAYAAALGDGEVLCLALHADKPAAPLELLHKVAAPEGFGPRHVRISPCGRWLYVVGEFSATVAIFKRDAATGRLTPHSVARQPRMLSHLSPGVARPLPANPVQPDPAALAKMVWGADMHVRPDGRFIYVSERTTSSLLVYRVDADKGEAQFVSSEPTEEQPRGFRIDPTGRYLIACGEKSTFVSAYGIDTESGALTRLSRCEGGRGANWVEII